MYGLRGGIAIRYLNGLFVFCLTIIIAYDYFPNVSQIVEVPKLVIIFLLIGLLLVGMLFEWKIRVDDKDALKWQVFITTYILFLMGLFTVLGGKSTVGMSFNNGFFWLVLLISLLKIISQWKKVMVLK